MPDILSPSLDTPNIDTPDIPTQLDFPKWDTPSVTIPPILKQTQDAFSAYPGNVPIQDFNKIVGDNLMPKQQDGLQDILPSYNIPLKNTVDFRTFRSSDAIRYKQNDRLWNKIGYNPELPGDIIDAMYDHKETSWESIKNVFPKMWNTASFQFKNYFQQYADTANAISGLDNMATQQRFKDYATRTKELEQLYPDYLSDRPSKWWQVARGDYWEESGSSLGFTLGTIGAALLENVAITAATSGAGEVGELYNTPRKMFNAISDYYSLKRAYGLVKSAIGAKNIIGELSAGANLWRLANGALAEASLEGFNTKNDYLQSFRQNYIDKNGVAPSKQEMEKAAAAGDKMSDATILWETPFLMASNAAQFGNIIAPKTISGILKKIGLEKEAFKFVINDAFKATVVGAEKEIKNPILRYASGALHGIKNSVWEGLEESYQALITKSTADYYNDKAFGKDGASINKSLGVGFDYLHSNTGMKEFSAGFMTGAIFQHAGKPFSYLARPKSLLNTEGEKEYRLNIFNKFGIGMNQANKEAERQKYEKIAENLNSVDLEKVLKEEGFLNLIKDKRTSLAMAKYVQNNDFFNVQNLKNLQLNRLLYAGLVTGKIDLQIDKLKQFAQQDFKTLQDFFDLDENEYQTQEEKQTFLNNFRNFTFSLSAKAKEFENIFEIERQKHDDVIKSSSGEHSQAIDEYNNLINTIKDKYKVDDVPQAIQDGKIDTLDYNKLLHANMLVLGTKMRFYGVNEAVKAAVFAQSGMMEDSKRASDLVTKLNSDDTTHIKYNHELGKLFDRGYRDERAAQLKEKLKDVVGEDKSVIQEQVDAFDALSSYLNKNFDQGETYDEKKIASLVQAYLYSIQKETNKLDNHLLLQERINNEKTQQFGPLEDFIKLQKRNQENLNLINYLSAGNNFQEYSNRQSSILTDFFSQAIDIADKENTPSPVAPQAAPQSQTVTQQPAQIAPQPAVQAPIAPQRNQTIQLKETLNNLTAAIRSDDKDEIDNLESIAKSYDNKLVMDYMTNLIDSDKMKEKYLASAKRIVGETFYDTYLTPPSQPIAQFSPEIPAATAPITVQKVPEAPQPTDVSKAGDPGRALAAKIREGKINKLGGFKTSTGFDVVWDAALEVIAKAIEGGAKLADAIEAALKYIRGTGWYKNSLPNKEEFEEKFTNHINSEANIPGLTDQENSLITELNLKDFSGSKIAPYTNILKDLASTEEAKKQALNDLWDQYVGDAEGVGNILEGKLSGMLEDLEYPEPKIRKGTELEKGLAEASTTISTEELLKKAEKAANVQNLTDVPEPASDILPPVGAFISGLASVTPGKNYISELIDQSRMDGNFTFEGVNPKEIDKIEDDKITLKTASDPSLLRHHLMMENLEKIIENDQNGEALSKYKMKLEFITPDNEKWMFKRDIKSNSIMSVMVDEKGEYLYFDNLANPTSEENGFPFGMEYEDKFYTSDFLSTSRNSLAKNSVPTFIKSNFGDDKAPLLTIVNLVHNKIPVYASILGVTAGTLSGFNNSNTLANEKQSSYKMRTFQELIDSGDINLQDIDVKIDGFYLNFPETRDTGQRVKIGSPTIYDRKSDIFIPLTGKKLKDVTFHGNTIPKDSQLYEVIDTLDKKGELSLSSLRPDKTRIINTEPDLFQVYTFLRSTLYGKLYQIVLTEQGTKIELKRNADSLKANSLWEAEINYVLNPPRFIDIPLSLDVSKEGEVGRTYISYEEFARDNFLTGAAQAIISKNDTRFTKINKRIVIKVDKSHAQLQEELSNGTKTNPLVTATEIQVGDKLFPVSDVSREFEVTGIEDNKATLVELVKENGNISLGKEISVNLDFINKKYTKIEKVQQPEVVQTSEAQQATSKKIQQVVQSSATAKIGTAARISATTIIRPTSTKSISDVSPSTVVGNAIDYVAKAIFSDNKLTFSDKVFLNKTNSTLGAYFVDNLHFDAVVKSITRIKNSLQEQGYTFHTGIKLYDAATNISAEIDLLLVNKDGLAKVADFKTSFSNFDERYLGLSYDDVTNKQYFATQGRIYSLLLEKNGISTSTTPIIIGLSVSSTEEKTAIDTKIVGVKDNDKFVFSFTQADVVDYYKNASSIDEVASIYQILKNQDIEKITGKKPRGTSPLEMSIRDINLVASSEEDLRHEIDRMSSMMGEPFVVNFVNAYNRERYGYWDVMAATLYKNAVAGTGYHEGWHKFSQLFLTVEEKLKLYKSLRDAAIPYIDRAGNAQNTSTHTDLGVEEMLADEWVKFVNEKDYKFPKPDYRGIIGLFRRMWRALKEWWSGAKNPTKLFRDLYSGNLRDYATRNINNVIWGRLNSSIINNYGNEMINHSRVNLYMGTTSYFLGQVLRENNLSFSWLGQNLKSEGIKDRLYNKFSDLLANRLDKLTIPKEVSIKLDYALSNKEAVILATMKQQGLRQDQAVKFLSQIIEINNILWDDSVFDDFYNYYTRNSEVDSIRDKSNLPDVAPTFDADEIKGIVEEYGEENEAADEEQDEMDGDGNANRLFGEGPNEKSAFMKAHKEVQDFYRVMPIVTGIDDNGDYIYKLNELDIPETYDYSTVFNKTKSLLSGQFAIEDITNRLSNPRIYRQFPQTKYIFDQLQAYINKPTNSNFSFVQKFIRVMALGEVDNKELTVNFDAVADRSAGYQRTAVRMRSLSRIGETQDITQWAYNFQRPSETRKATIIDDNSSSYNLYNNKDVSNILYNLDGTIVLNPFYDWNAWKIGENTEQFLHIMGIDLDERFWQDSESSTYATQLESLFVKNLQRYQEYTNYLMNTQYLDETKTVEDIKKITSPARADIEKISKELFMRNPIQSFRERKSYKMGDKIMETYSLTYAMEDVSRQNAIYSLVSSSKSFTDGAGKMKWPFYESSLIIYRTYLLNKVQNIKDFNNDIEFQSLNPNLCPWLKTSLFYKAIFDDRGNRNVISYDVKANDDSELSAQKVKVMLSDLSSYKITDSNNARKYTSSHPKSLSPQDKMFFDITTLVTSGDLEIPRAATSSTMFSLKLNSYASIPVGTTFRSQFLPVDFSGIYVGNTVGGKLSIAFPGNRFPSIMRGYLSADLQKMKWYADNNPENKLASTLNIFKEILPEELATRLMNETKDLKGNISDKVNDLINSNKPAIDQAITSFFSTYITNLWNNKTGPSMLKMSTSQRSILSNLANLYQNRTQFTDKEDLARARAIAENTAITGQQSVQQSAVEKANMDTSASLALIAGVFAMNQFILNVEYHTWYMGDNYLFSNPFKRGNLTSNTGVFAIVSPFTNDVLNKTKGETMYSILTGDTSPKDYRKVKTHVFRDVITKSRYVDIHANDLINYEKSYKALPSTSTAVRRTEILDTLSPYTTINSADGQSKIGLDAYRTFRKIFGTWDDVTDEKEYQRQIAILRLHLNKYKDDESRRKDEELVKKGPYSQFNPQKWSATGPELVLDSKGGQTSTPMRTKFDKTSLHPLLPGVLLGSGNPDETLMMDMAMNDVDYIKFQSAAKGVEHGGIVDYFDSFGGEITNVKLEDASPEWLLSTYIKNQLSTDKQQTDNTWGSQSRVLVFDVKYLPEVQSNPKLLKTVEDYERDYLDATQNIQDFQLQQFINTFGLQEEDKGTQTYRVTIKDPTIFTAAINSLAKRNNFPTNMLEYLEYNPSSGEYTYDPSLVFSRKMLIDAIGGIIDNDLRRLKLKGTAAIQVTSVGNTTHKYVNPTDDDIRKYGTNGLHFYHLEYDDKGNVTRTSTMGVKITLQGDFKNLLNLKWNGKIIGDLATLNKAIQDENFKKKHIEKLTFYGYRIPTNDNNFIDHAEIMEFIPEEAGNIIISPMEQIIKSGSDFDVDKMNLVFPSIDITGELTSLPVEQIPIKLTKEEIKEGVPQKYTQIPLTIEDIYTRLNKKTSSIRDYREDQKWIKRFIKGDKKVRNMLLKAREERENAIRLALYNEDSTLYNGLVVAKNSLPEIIEAFKYIISSNDELSGRVANLKLIDEKLGLDLVNEAKEDHEFNKLIKSLNSYKDFYTNKMLDSLRGVLSLPSYFQMLISPSNTSYLTTLANEIGALTNRSVNDKLPSTSNMLYTTVNQKFKEYLGDSGDIGPYSRQRVWFSFLNYAKIELNRDWKYFGSQMRILIPLAPPAQRNEIGTYDNIRMYGPNLNNMSVSKIWDQFMSLTIDLPTSTIYTLFGINKHNKKVIQYLISSRYSVPSAFYFINQPILQELYSLWEKKNKTISGYSLKHAMFDLLNSKNITSQELVSLQPYDVNKETGEETVNIFVKHPGLYTYKLLSEADYFSPEDMKADMSSSADKNSKEYKERQKKILLYFITLSLEASNFTGMQFVFSDDRNKNTNYYTIEENNRKRRGMRGNEYDDLPPDGSMFEKTGLRKLETNSIYSMFTYGKIAQLFYEQFAKEFTDLLVASNFMKLLDSTNTYGIDKQLLATRMEGDYIEAIYKNFGEFDINVYNPFSDTIESPVDKLAITSSKFGAHFMQNIFNLNKDPQFKTYGEKLTKFLEKYPELKEVEFIKHLYPLGLLEKTKLSEDVDLNELDMYNANVIRFNRSQENTIQERNFYAKQLENLVVFQPAEFRLTKDYTADDMKKISAFFTELAYLTLYQSGPTNIADNFSDLIPSKMWEQFSSSAFKNYKKAIADGKIRQGDFLKMFDMMYIENNKTVPWKSPSMVYNLKYYGEQITDKNIRRVANTFRQPIQFFQNFTAGKMYDVQVFAQKVQFKVAEDLNC